MEWVLHVTQIMKWCALATLPQFADDVCGSRSTLELERGTEGRSSKDKAGFCLVREKLEPGTGYGGANQGAQC